MTKLFAVCFIIFVGASLTQAKVIFVGSHGRVDTYIDYWEGGECRSPLVIFDINENSTIEQVRSVGDQHGVDASIAFFRSELEILIFDRVFRNIANPSLGKESGKNFVQQNYKEGDYVFLVGYSVGGKYVINLADELEKESIPIHFLGMIDPVLGFNISILKNVKLAEVYIQRNEVFDFQGSWFFFYNSSETEYHSYTVVGDVINHYSVDNEEIVWKNLSGRMLSIVGINIVPGDGSDDGISPENVAIEEDPKLTSFDQEADNEDESMPVDQNIPQVPGTPWDGYDHDVGLKYVELCRREGEHCKGSIYVELNYLPKWDIRAKLKRKGGQWKDVTVDYYCSDDRDFDQNDLHLGSEEKELTKSKYDNKDEKSVYLTNADLNACITKSGTYYLFVVINYSGGKNPSTETDSQEHVRIIVEAQAINTHPQTGRKYWDDLTPGEQATLIQMLSDYIMQD